jgi:hypothetical protein
VEVQFGNGNVYFISINQETGAIAKSITVAVNNSANDKYDTTTRILTVPTLTGFSVNDYVVLNLENQNKYSFGQVVTTTTVRIDVEADDSIFTSYNGNIDFVKGVGAGLFKDSMVTTTSTPVEFKGNNKFNRYVTYTDIEGTVTIGEMILNDACLEYLNGFDGGIYGAGSGVAVMDNQYGESTSPIDVAVIIVKDITGEDDKQEEIFCHRVSSSTLALPFNRSNYITQNYEFTVQRKSSGNPDIIDYIYEE